jgi:hypothetical protein
VKRTLVAVALAVIFVMALAAPALAQSIMHTATYEMDGTIDFEKQAGHLCNTGAEVKQTISGNGVMDKVQTVSMVAGKITMADDNNWVAGATALTVTTVWELCTPPKYTYEDDDGNEAIVHPAAMYNEEDQPYAFGPNSTLTGYDFIYTGYDQADTYDDWEAVSDQIWAVQVQADPGFSGNLKQDGVAAYGAYDASGWDALPVGDDDDFDDPADSRWAWANEDFDVVVGEDYVGNYFTMDQHARTSQGTLRRYIDISSPFSHGYLMEDMSVVGESDITEAFSMGNLSPGADVPGLWWDLF